MYKLPATMTDKKMAESKPYPERMKAVFSEKPGNPLVVKEVDIPVPGSGEVLIKIAAAPINPSDLAMIRNVYFNKDLNSFIPGLEGSGTVVGVGKGLLPRLWKGKRVACSSHYITAGTWAEYMVTKAVKCYPLNSKVTDEQGCMSLVNPLTALAFIEIARENKHKAIINNAAASALGRMVELLGKKNNIPVINIVRSRKHVEMLKVQGSEYVLDSSDASFFDELGSLSDELKATILFDSVCSRQIAKMIEVLPSGSSVIIYGNLSGHEHIHINPRSLMDKKINISGFYLRDRSNKNGLLKNVKNLREVSRLMSSDMKIKIQARFPLDKATEAIDTYINNMSGGKVLFTL
jgi:NADPH:quinone reductase